MARLRWGDIHAIKHKILNNLYGANEESIKERKEDIAMRNREYFMEPLRPIMDQLPFELLRQSSRYQLFINYKLNNTDLMQGVCEVWEYDSSNPTDVNPLWRHIPPNSAQRVHDIPGNLDSRLALEAAQLCEETIALRTEKIAMKEFLDTTTSQYSGSLQLRKVWPASLHKYLPPEPTKNTTKSIKASAPQFTSPTFLNTRLTNNLIEGK
jgi:hypothetical protein